MAGIIVVAILASYLAWTGSYGIMQEPPGISTLRRDASWPNGSHPR